MSNFNIVPGVDDGHNFPPEIRKALAQAAELGLVFTKIDQVTSAVQQYVTSLVVTNSNLQALSTTTGYTWALVDQDGRLAFGVRPDGTTYISKMLLAAGSIARSMLDASTQAGLVDSSAAPMLGPVAPANIKDYVWVVADQDGRVALGIRPDGHVVSPGLEIPNASITAAKLGVDVPLPVQFSEGSGFVWAVTDQDGRIGLGIHKNGQLFFNSLDSQSIQYLIAALSLSSAVSPLNYSMPDGTIRPITSGPDIICWGDSLTAGAGSTTAAGIFPSTSGGYPAVLATLSGKTVRNGGVGGETSPTITARAGANPFLLLPDTGQIPASGPVNVTISQINGQPIRPLLQGNGAPGGGFDGTLAGIPGTLSLVQPGGASSTFTVGTDYYVFTRTTPGSAVACTRPLPYRTTFSKARRNDIAIIWVGQNGPSDTRSIADAQSIIRHLATLNQRWLVISRPTSTDAIDSTYHDAFGRRFISIRQYLVSYGLADAGITPTTQDTTDMTNGVVPTSLRIDSVHFNAAGYNILGQQVYARLTEHGWI